MASTILAKAKPSGQVDVEPTHYTGQMDALEQACKELMDAVHAKDPRAMAKALQSAMELCDSPEEDPKAGI